MLDTDTMSIWQFGPPQERAILQLNVSAHPVNDVGVSVVSFQEQSLGCHNYLLQSRTTSDLVRGYLRWEKVLFTYLEFPTVAFDVAAGSEFDRLRAARIRIGTMDLRIASIALARNLTLVTRNAGDFGKVPGLKIEDWTNIVCRLIMQSVPQHSGPLLPAAMDGHPDGKSQSIHSQFHKVHDTLPLHYFHDNTGR